MIGNDFYYYVIQFRHTITRIQLFSIDDLRLTIHDINTLYSAGTRHLYLNLFVTEEWGTVHYDL